MQHYISLTFLIDNANEVRLRENLVNKNEMVLEVGEGSNTVYVYADVAVWESVLGRALNLVHAHYLGEIVDDTPDLPVDLIDAPTGEIPRDFDPDWIEVDEDGVPVPNDDAEYVKEVLS